MKLQRFEGCWTAMITPLDEKGELDLEGLRRNARFQISQGAKLVPMGTTGESPTLDWKEHDIVIEEVVKLAKGEAFIMAGTGSNCTKEALRATRHARDVGADAVLLVDCYYNGPSSMELRTQYHGVIAKEFPDLFVTPYIIPGRTGTQMEVEDMAILHRQFMNVRAVKEATGDLERMAKTKVLLGNDFDILSGDDDMTFEMMSRHDISASGVVSVMSNIVPGAIAEMTRAILGNERDRGMQLKEALDPLFQIVTVKTIEEYEGFTVPCKFRNPLPIKTLMNGLGLPSGPCRPPLGRMTPKGVGVVRQSIRGVYERNKEVLMPIQDYYKVNLKERIDNDEYWR
ncbi:MAG: 4-hydroxy-tetrahydrodipicolinate synthase [Syntrophobacterales bacterium]|nr:MAG: 4-hydroxy-tetrahydrodipicolinate synthase [Syntrophobacterales bacterium]